MYLFIQLFIYLVIYPVLFIFLFILIFLKRNGNQAVPSSVLLTGVQSSRTQMGSCPGKRALLTKNKGDRVLTELGCVSGQFNSSLQIRCKLSSGGAHKSM